MLRDSVKSALKRVFASAGLEVKSIARERDAPIVYESLSEAKYKRNSGETAAFRCELNKCVTFHGFPCSPTGWHPFVEAAKEYLRSKGRQRYEGSILERYYSAWQPSNALDALIGAERGPEILKQYPSFVMHNPWIDISPEERESFMKKTIREENLYGAKLSLSESAGYGLHGPVTKKKGYIEYERLVKTVDSIKRRGYIRAGPDSDITVVGLRKSDDARYCIAHGQHRVAALTALGYDDIAAVPIKVVEVEEISHWPQVYRGTWSEQEASEYINHLFDFDSKAWAKKKGLI